MAAAALVALAPAACHWPTSEEGLKRSEPVASEKRVQPRPHMS